MDNDLQRSVRFLEDAVSCTSPKSVLFKKPREKRQPPKSEESFVCDSNVNEQALSLYMDAERILTGSVIQMGAPWKSTMDNLFMEFADCLQSAFEDSDILDMARDLGRCCCDAIAVIKKLKSKVTSAQITEEIWLEDERNSWRLLHAMYRERLHGLENDDLDVYTGLSEKLCVEALYNRNNLIREHQLVVDWLEKNAADKHDAILCKSDWPYGWEHTYHQLISPGNIAIASNRDIITTYHPDAPESQGRNLHHLDEENEVQVCSRMFAEIRCGKLEKAQEFCANCGHAWRSAMLEGWKLYHNPYLKEHPDYEIPTEGDYEFEGNQHRDLWKANAIDFCANANLNIHEKAAVASLCGYLKAMLAVCDDWNDYLWAYMKTMVDIRVESEVRDSIVRNYVPLPDEYWEQKASLSEIFKVLETSPNQKVRTQSKEISRVIQKLIILDEIPAMIKYLDERSQDADISTQALRFFAHLIIFFTSVGKGSDKKSCDRIIKAYIARLSDMNETQLVAFYVGKIGKLDQVAIYATHLERLLDNEERKMALAYAENCNLDVFAITKRIVESIRNRVDDPEVVGNLHNKLSELDKLKISALDWVLFHDEQHLEALHQTNALIFKFLALRKLEAADLALKKIPHRVIESITQQRHQHPEIEPMLKTYLCFKAYLDAQEAFNAWFKQFGNKPLPPAQLAENASYTEKVAHQHRMSQFNAETDRWHLITNHSAKTAKTLLYNVLLFPESWLINTENCDYLRSVCLPEVVLLLYKILSESNLHEEAVQLADIVASEKHCLYKVYSKDKLGELLEKIAESSVALLNAKKDPWGNKTTA